MLGQCVFLPGTLKHLWLGNVSSLVLSKVNMDGLAPIPVWLGYEHYIALTLLSLPGYLLENSLFLFLSIDM